MYPAAGEGALFRWASGRLSPVYLIFGESRYELLREKAPYLTRIILRLSRVLID